MEYATTLPSAVVWAGLRSAAGLAECPATNLSMLRMTLAMVLGAWRFAEAAGDTGSRGGTWAPSTVCEARDWGRGRGGGRGVECGRGGAGWRARVGVCAVFDGGTSDAQCTPLPPPLALQRHAHAKHVHATRNHDTPECRRVSSQHTTLVSLCELWSQGVHSDPARWHGQSAGSEGRTSPTPCSAPPSAAVARVAAAAAAAGPPPGGRGRGAWPPLPLPPPLLAWWCGVRSHCAPWSLAAAPLTRPSSQPRCVGCGGRRTPLCVRTR